MSQIRRLLFLALLFPVMSVPAADIPNEGEPAPPFELPDQNGTLHRLADYRGSWVVLYFYPKDDTPGCTEEACNFRDDIFRLQQLGAQVIGCSVDSVASHAEFAGKHSLPFPLLADEEAQVAEAYGAITNLLVAKFAKRYTFLIDPQGRVAKRYLQVDTARHSEEIISDLKALQQPAEG